MSSRYKFLKNYLHVTPPYRRPCRLFDQARTKILYSAWEEPLVDWAYFKMNITLPYQLENFM